MDITRSMDPYSILIVSHEEFVKILIGLRVQRRDPLIVKMITKMKAYIKVKSQNQMPSRKDKSCKRLSDKRKLARRSRS